MDKLKKTYKPKQKNIIKLTKYYNDVKKKLEDGKRDI